MKKIILSAMALCAFTFANAQDGASASPKFGAKAALNVANNSGDVENNSSLIAYQIGFYAEFKISDKFSIQPELMYSVQGHKESFTEYISPTETITGDGTVKLSYLNIPVMAKYYITPKLSAEFGPQIGFLLSAKIAGDASYTDSAFPEDNFTFSGSEDIKDQVSSVDFGLNFGAGYDITEKLSAGVRYNLGLSNVNDAEGDDSNVTNTVISVSLGYAF